MTLETRLADWSDSSAAARAVELALRLRVPDAKVGDWHSLEELGERLEASPEQVAAARERLGSDDVKKAVGALDHLDEQDGLWSNLKAAADVIAAWRDGRSDRGALGDRQGRDAMFKALVLAWVVDRLFPGTDEEKVRRFLRLESGRALVGLYGLVEVALPFAQEVAEKGMLGRIAQQYAEPGMKAVVAELGESAPDHIRGVMPLMVGELEDAVTKAAKDVDGVLSTARKLAPAAATAADTAGDIAAASIDLLPVYHLIAPRLAAEACLQRELLGEPPEAPAIEEPAPAAAPPAPAEPDAAAAAPPARSEEPPPPPPKTDAPAPPPPKPDAPPPPKPPAPDVGETIAPPLDDDDEEGSAPAGPSEAFDLFGAPLTEDVPFDGTPPPPPGEDAAPSVDQAPPPPVDEAPAPLSEDKPAPSEDGPPPAPSEDGPPPPPIEAEPPPPPAADAPPPPPVSEADTAIRAPLSEADTAIKAPLSEADTKIEAPPAGLSDAAAAPPPVPGLPPIPVPVLGDTGVAAPPPLPGEEEEAEAPVPPPTEEADNTWDPEEGETDIAPPLVEPLAPMTADEAGPRANLGAPEPTFDLEDSETDIDDEGHPFDEDYDGGESTPLVPEERELEPTEAGPPTVDPDAPEPVATRPGITMFDVDPAAVEAARAEDEGRAADAASKMPSKSSQRPPPRPRKANDESPANREPAPPAKKRSKLPMLIGVVVVGGGLLLACGGVLSFGGAAAFLAGNPDLIQQPKAEPKPSPKPTPKPKRRRPRRR